MSLEQNLFTWKSWDLADNFVMQFVDCELKQDIGRYKKGDFVPVIVMDMESSVLQFMTYEGYVLKEYNLVLSIGEEI